jgi:hypothetical protein
MESLVHLTVQARIVGRRKSFVPLELDLEGSFATVRDLLSSIVRGELERFQARKEQATYFRLLTERDIQDGCDSGKLISGNQETDPRAPTSEQAVDAALLAFKDRLYYMFLNDTQVEHLDHDISREKIRDVLFVRLTPLAGG